MPFSLGLPVAGKDFFGREKQLTDILSLLQAGSAVNFFSLRRMGKSSLLHQIRYLCNTAPLWEQYQPIFVDMMSTDGSLAESLLWRLGISSRNSATGDNAWRQIELQIQRNTGKVILLFDEFSYGFENGVSERDYAPLRALQQAGLVNIIASTLYGSISDHSQHHDTLASPIYNVFYVFRLPSFLPEEAEDLLVSLCRRGGVTLEVGLAKELARYVGYYPNLVQEIGFIAFRYLSQGTKVPVGAVTAEWRELYGRRWLPTLLRPFQEGYAGISLTYSGKSKDQFIKESLEDYGILYRNEASNLVVAPYIADLLQGNYSAEEALDRMRALVNAVNLGESAHRERRSDELVTVLFLAADPTDATRLRLSEELREIQEKLRLAKLRDRFLLQQRMSVRPADISQALLDTQPQIVHFSGHGEERGELCFENLPGETHSVGPDALAALFQQFASQVTCVVLNACYSEIQARAIAKHIDYVIGMNQAIADKAAVSFAIGFYQALGAGRTIDEAYNLGCVQIRLQGIAEHLTPVLVKREQASQPPIPD